MIEVLFICQNHKLSGRQHRKFKKKKKHTHRLSFSIMIIKTCCKNSRFTVCRRKIMSKKGKKKRMFGGDGLFTEVELVTSRSLSYSKAAFFCFLEVMFDVRDSLYL